MNASRTITIFSEPPAGLPRRPSGVLVSTAVHGVAIGLMYLGILRPPELRDLAHIRRYTVHLLDMHRPEPKPKVDWASAKSRQPGAHRASAAKGAPASAAAAQTAQINTATQTLIQPDLPPDLLLSKELAIPHVLLWSADNSARRIFPPPPKEMTTASVLPVLQTPNREVKLAEINISASAFMTQAPTLPPSTTSPVVVRGPQPTEQAPETTSKASGPPTPARVISLSDLEMPEGTIVVPEANQTAPSNAAGLALGHALGLAATGEGSKQGRSGVGDGSGAGNAEASVAGEGGATAGTGNAGSAVAIASGGPGGDGEPTVKHISLRRDGSFGMVVVGSSLADKYPEVSSIWSGRLAYTVYLHVGLPQNWILQYSLPRSAEVNIAGGSTRPEAPWPYDIERPHLEAGDVNADAIMVHGLVNAAGRFEQLAVVFPLQFAQAKFLLDALQQWQFRPAKQNGQIAAVEVLLIIPPEAE